MRAVLNKCNDCGKGGFQGSSCPDCGGGNLTETTAQVVQAIGVALPGSGQEDQVITMPDPGLVLDSRPVIGIIVLPDKRNVELYEGDEFIVRHASGEGDAHFLVDNDETVSGTPVKVVTENGQAFVTGGGSNGYTVMITRRYKPGDKVELPRDATRVEIGVGKDTRIRFK